MTMETIKPNMAINLKRELSAKYVFQNFLFIATIYHKLKICQIETELLFVGEFTDGFGFGVDINVYFTGMFSVCTQKAIFTSICNQTGIDVA